MKKVVIAICGALTVLWTGLAGAADFKVGDLVVSDTWARASASKAMKAGAAFAVLSNEGQEMDRLIAAASPVAKKTELHTHLMEGGIMKMRQVEAMEVHPGAPTVLQPGGLHIMFMGLHAPLVEGSEIPITLTFEKAGDIAITAKVLSAGARSMPEHGGKMHKGHKPGS